MWSLDQLYEATIYIYLLSIEFLGSYWLLILWPYVHGFLDLFLIGVISHPNSLNLIYEFSGNPHNKVVL